MSAGVWLPLACLAGAWLIGYVCGRVDAAARHPAPPPPPGGAPPPPLA